MRESTCLKKYPNYLVKENKEKQNKTKNITQDYY